jgi:hypothetical protein
MITHVAGPSGLSAPSFLSIVQGLIVNEFDKPKMKRNHEGENAIGNELGKLRDRLSVVIFESLAL